MILKKKCGVLFVDFAKTFDAVDHDLLLHKLAVYGLFPETLTLHHFLQLESKLNVNASTSNARSVKCGVPQGSVTLFYLHQWPPSIHQNML